MFPSLATVFIFALSLLTACAPSPLAGGLDSSVPSARMHAARDVVRRDDRSAATIRRLIEQLDSDDAGVRLLAIGALERLTGETLGYRYDDPPVARQDAIELWLAYPLGDESPVAGTASPRTVDHG